METTESTIAAPAAISINLELQARGVSIEKSGTMRRFNFEITKGHKQPGVPEILAGTEVFAAQSVKEEAYAEGSNRVHANPKERYLTFLDNAELVSEEGNLLNSKFVGGDYRLLCSLRDGLVYVNAALPPGEVVQDDNSGI